MKIKPIKFIEKKWLAIILIASLIEPVHYFLLINYPLPGKTFMAYDADEATVAGVMRSVELDFDNPWSKGEKVLFNGALGSPYPYLALELTQEDIDRGAPFDAKRVYGPIPEQGGAT